MEKRNLILYVLKEDIKQQLEEFEAGDIDVWELIKRIEKIVNK